MPEVGTSVKSYPVAAPEESVTPPISVALSAAPPALPGRAMPLASPASPTAPRVTVTVPGATAGKI